MKDKRLYATILFLVASFCAYSQSKKYVVMDFEERRSIDKVYTNYFWIIPMDSIHKGSMDIYPLCYDGYDKNQLGLCGDTINVLLTGGGIHLTKEGIAEDYGDSPIRELFDIIRHKRKKMQSIEVKWPDRSFVEVNIYAIPIEGEFCEYFLYESRLGYLFKTAMYFPVSGFKFIEEFWSTENGRTIEHSDYGKIRYSHIIGMWRLEGDMREASTPTFYGP
jgi:hypothetical protein